MKQRTFSVKQKLNPEGLTCYAVMVSSSTYKDGAPIEAGGYRDRWLFWTYEAALADCQRRAKASWQNGIAAQVIA